MGLMDFLRRVPKTPPPSNMAMAMVMLEPGETFRPGDLAAHARERWPEAPALGGITGDGDTATGLDTSDKVLMMHMPMPIPPPSLEGPIALAWHWRGAREEVARHRSHIVATISSDSASPFALRTLHTKLLASILATHPSIGVYVGDATLIRRASHVLKDADEMTSRPPLFSWISVCPVAMPSRKATAYTKGLTWFGLRELEVRECSMPFKELVGRIADTASYQVRHNLQIAHGHTVGDSATERIPVTHERSMFVPRMPVARIAFP